MRVRFAFSTLQTNESQTRTSALGSIHDVQRDELPLRVEGGRTLNELRSSQKVKIL